MIKELDYSKLRGRIREVYRTEEIFSSVLGITKETLSRKLNNKAGFKSGEILDILKLLKIPKNEVNDYFFTFKNENIH